MLRMTMKAAAPSEPATLARAAFGLSPDGLDAIDDAVLAFDDAGHITYCNPAAERLYDIASERIVGRRISDLLLPGPLPLFGALADGRFARLLLDNGRAVHITRSGRRVPVQVTLLECDGAPVDPTWHIAIIRDDTERDALE